MYTNTCSRCGKERIFVREWKEKIGYSVVTTVEKSCPDDDCQKMVEAANNKQNKKTRDAEQRRRERLGRNRKPSVRPPVVLAA